MKMVRVNECSSKFGVNYEEVLDHGDSILVRVIVSSSYRGFELSGLHVFFYISNQFISNQGSGFLKITIEYNGLLLC